MFKHIVGQSIYQIIIIMVLVFTGESWIPEEKDSFDDNKSNELCKKYHNWHSKMTIKPSGEVNTTG